ncbi:MAG: hypothetical protein JRN15_23195, partial [Nitrososphaerota archaeon]|nr:hypothetical protein [Nitrososphaerota archaeon]
RIITKLILILLIAGLLIAAFPTLAGQAEGQFFNENLKGYWIPPDYQSVRGYLYSHPGHVLVLPGMSTYFQTKWGFQGSNHFYIAYFAPTPVYTEDSFSGGYASTTLRSIYYNLTEPLLLSSSDMPIMYNPSPSVISVSNGRYELVNKNLVIHPSNLSHDVVLSIAFSRPIDISNFTNLGIAIKLDPYLAGVALSSGQLWIGLRSSSTIGWYILGEGANSYVISHPNSTYDFFLSVGNPSPVWPSSTYNSSSVADLVLRFPANQTSITMSLPELFGTKGTIVDPRWFNMITSYQIQYLLLDKSVVSGNLTSPQFDNDLLAALSTGNHITSIFNGTDLELLKLESV